MEFLAHYESQCVYTRLQKRWHLISLIHERQDPTPLWEMFAQIHNQWFTSLIIHGKIFSHDKTFSSGKVWIALIIHYVQLMVIINACCVSTFLQSSVVSKRLNYIIRGKTIMPKGRAIWTLRLLKLIADSQIPPQKKLSMTP